MCEGPARGSVPVFQAEFQQLIGLNLQLVCQVEQQSQRQPPVNIRGFNGTHVLAADPNLLRQLLLS